MTARLHLLVLTLATIGLLLTQPTSGNPWVVSVAVQVGATAAMLVGVAALSVLPQALPVSLLAHGSLFALYTTAQIFTSDGPEHFLYLGCATLGVLGYLSLRLYPPSASAEGGREPLGPVAGADKPHAVHTDRRWVFVSGARQETKQDYATAKRYEQGLPDPLPSHQGTIEGIVTVGRRIAQPSGRYVFSPCRSYQQDLQGFAT